jgi:hypothetical protein
MISKRRTAIVLAMLPLALSAAPMRKTGPAFAGRMRQAMAMGRMPR